MGRQLETPRATQHEIDKNGAVVHLLAMEMSVPPQAPRMFRIVALCGSGEEGQVPIFGYIPVERVERIDKDKEEPVKVSILFF